MRHKDLKECIARLNAMRSNGNLKPEQRDQISLIISELKKLARKRTLKHVDVFDCVNEVTRRLLKLLGP
jgi:hypothetical protein